MHKRFRQITDAQVKAVQDRLNARPRKVLGYRTRPRCSTRSTLSDGHRPRSSFARTDPRKTGASRRSLGFSQATLSLPRLALLPSQEPDYAQIWWGFTRKSPSPCHVFRSGYALAPDMAR